MCSCNSSGPDFYSETVVTAAKPFSCEECSRHVLSGEVYIRASGKWDGEFDSFKLCRRCVAMMTSAIRIGSKYDLCFEMARVASCLDEVIEYGEDQFLRAFNEEDAAIVGHAYGLVMRLRHECADRKEAFLRDKKKRREGR